MKVKIIVLDLDGTLLSSDKTLSAGNRDALQRAADAGVLIVPSTGRFYNGMPEVIRSLPFVRYVIAINGAEVYDAVEKKSLAKAEMSPEQADAVFSYLETEPVIFDCYLNDWGWMDRSRYDRAEQYTHDPHVLKMIKDLRTPVDDLRRFVRESGHGVQKIQTFFDDMDERARAFGKLHELFPTLSITSSIKNNIEINSAEANKGTALRKLCGYLQIDLKASMAFGDGLNDLTMIRDAGLGVAMRDSAPEVLAAADYVTCGNDEDGVAAAIRKFVLD